jgi:hypothetical protein
MLYCAYIPVEFADVFRVVFICFPSAALLVRLNGFSDFMVGSHERVYFFSYMQAQMISVMNQQWKVTWSLQLQCYFLEGWTQ